MDMLLQLIDFRHELYNTGVTVHILEPGFFGTTLVTRFTSELGRRLIQERVDQLPAEVKQRYGKEFQEKSTPITKTCTCNIQRFFNFQ